MRHGSPTRRPPPPATPGGSGDPSREEPLPLGPRGAAEPAPSPGESLPFGPRDLSEARSTRQVAPGVRYTRIVRGESSASDVYTVDVAFRADRSAAEALAAELRADGHDPSVLRVAERAPTTPPAGRSAGACGSAASGPRPRRSPSVTGSQPRATPAPGSSSRARTEAGPRVAEVEPIRTRLRARASEGATREIDGLNRKPGLIRGCGGSGGDLPTEAPKHDFTCTDASELILFTEDFGATTEPGEGAEAALDRRGRVIGLRESRGGAIPTGGSVLAGTGEAADWLSEHARPGSRVRTRASLGAGRGTSTAAAADRRRSAARTDIVNGGPRLLRNGRPSINAFAEGFHWPEIPDFFYRFGVRRNPRPLAGVTASGRVLLVAIDGRRPGYSAGASFKESAVVMEALGTRDALNLDGGGSTGMTVGSELVTRPSDPTGERPIADAILIGR